MSLEYRNVYSNPLFYKREMIKLPDKIIIAFFK